MTMVNSNFPSRGGEAGKMGGAGVPVAVRLAAPSPIGDDYHPDRILPPELQCPLCLNFHRFKGVCPTCGHVLHTTE